MADAVGGSLPNYTVPCARCGETVIAPLWSQHVSEYRVRHHWVCEACRHEFQTAVHLCQPDSAAARMLAA